MEKETQNEITDQMRDFAFRELEEMLSYFKDSVRSYLWGCIKLRDIVDSGRWKLHGEYHSIDEFFSDRLSCSRSTAWKRVALVRMLEPWFAKKPALMEVEKKRLIALASVLNKKSEEEQNDLIESALTYPESLFHEKIKVAKTGIEPETCPHIHRKIVCCDCGKTLERFKENKNE